MAEDYASNVKRQKGTPGLQKEIHVKSYPSAAELADILKGIAYPVDKNTLLNSVIGRNTNKTVTELLGHIEDKSYNNASEVVTATGLVIRE